MRIWVIALPLLLSACVASQVASTGKDSYSLSATRCKRCEPAPEYVVEQAGAYCESIHKNALVSRVISDNRQPMFPGSATVFFACLNADDPRYQASLLRKDQNKRP
jgi:hypothetical protein